MTHTPRPPEWQMPPGVTPGLWEYLHDADLASQYLTKVSDSPFAQADQAFVEKHLPRPCRVIDLGCGPGRSLLPLAQRGFECTGIDLSEAMLKVASDRFSAEKLNADWVRANLCETLPCPDRHFDAAICLFGTLGMLHPASARETVLRETHRILQVGGLLVLHVHNNLDAYCWKNVLRRPSKKLGVVTMPVHQGIANLQMKLFSLREITQLLYLSGFRTKSVEPVSAPGSGALGKNPRHCDGFLIAAYRVR